MIAWAREGQRERENYLLRIYRAHLSRVEKKGRKFNYILFGSLEFVGSK